jgi:hypothetical protein
MMDTMYLLLLLLLLLLLIDHCPSYTGLQASSHV